VRIIASYITRGQKVSAQDPLYTLSDADGRQFNLEFAENGIVAETPLPVGSMFEQPLPVAYLQPDDLSQAGKGETQTINNGVRGPAAAPKSKTIDELIAELDETAKNKLWQDYKLSVENHLRTNGVPFEEAMRQAGDFDVKQRWQALNLPTKEQASSQQAHKAEPERQASPSSTQTPEEDKPKKTAIEFIEELDAVAKNKTWIDYKLTVERHLKANGFLSMQSQKLAGEDRVKKRWQALNNASNAQSTSQTKSAIPDNQEAVSANSSAASDPATGSASTATRPANPIGDSARPVQAANNYFTFAFAVVAGALATAIYAFLAKVIPLFMIGAIVPFVFAWVAIMLAYMPLRGDRPSRIVICVFGAVVNLAVVWFVNFWMIFNLDDALEIMASGPIGILYSIEYLSREAGLMIGDLTSSSSLEISGGFLLAIWAFEAVALSSAVFIGYRASAELQDVSAVETVSENISTMKNEVFPGLGKIVFGIIKGTIPVLLIFGIAYFLNEHVL